MPNIINYSDSRIINDPISKNDFFELNWKLNINWHFFSWMKFRTPTHFFSFWIYSVWDTSLILSEKWIYSITNLYYYNKKKILGCDSDGRLSLIVVDFLQNHCDFLIGKPFFLLLIIFDRVPIFIMAFLVKINIIINLISSILCYLFDISFIMFLFFMVLLWRSCRAESFYILDFWSIVAFNLISSIWNTVIIFYLRIIFW